MKEGIHIETLKRTGKGQARISKQNKIKLTSCKFCNYCHPLKSTAQSKLMLKIQNETQITFSCIYSLLPFHSHHGSFHPRRHQPFNNFSNKELIEKIHIKTRARSYWTILPRWWQTVALGRERLPSMHSLHPPHSPPPKVILNVIRKNWGSRIPAETRWLNMIILADQRGKVGW